MRNTRAFLHPRFSVAQASGVAEAVAAFVKESPRRPGTTWRFVTRYTAPGRIVPAHGVIMS
jgi:hypothetical protein